jgi:hypothetical protein
MAQRWGSPNFVFSQDRTQRSGDCECNARQCGSTCYECLVTCLKCIFTCSALRNSGSINISV